MSVTLSLLEAKPTPPRTPHTAMQRHTPTPAASPMRTAFPLHSPSQPPLPPAPTVPPLPPFPTPPSVSALRLHRGDEPVKDEMFVDGDLSIQSCDGVIFRIPSFYLFAASSVFRDKPATSYNLTDPTETADIVRTFLSLATTWRLDFAATRPLLPRLLPFLRKYDARPAFDLAMGAINTHLAQLGRPTAFLLGAAAADTDMCVAALGEDAHELLQLVWGFGRREFEDLPQDYRWALWRTAGATHCVDDGERLAKVFTQALEEAQRGAWVSRDPLTADET